MRHSERTTQNPKIVGKRELPKFDVIEALALGLMLLLAFLSGVVFVLRLSDGGMY